jgi:SAM-dependent methyltransferase
MTGWWRRASAVAGLCALGAMFTPAIAQRPGVPVPYVPTPPEVVAAMLDVARVDSTDVVYDLGSGDGRIVIAAARDHGARGLGVDINPDLVDAAQRNARRDGVQERAEFRQQDLFELDLEPATVVTLYLLSSVNLRLRPRLLEQLRPGTRVVSHAFHMGEWRPDSTLVVPHNGGGSAQVYFWTIPARAEGSWRFTVGRAPSFVQRLEQRFQELGVSPGQEAGGRIVSGRLRGLEVELTMVTRQGGAERRRTLRGTVNGDSMSGMVEGTGERWSALRTED